MSETTDTTPAPVHMTDMEKVDKISELLAGIEEVHNANGWFAGTETCFDGLREAASELRRARSSMLIYMSITKESE